jgi:hypothetical protein
MQHTRFVAIVSFLFSSLARKASRILRAVFGWSLTALFDRLPAAKKVLDQWVVLESRRRTQTQAHRGEKHGH